MNSRRLLTLYFVLVLVAMTWVSWYACVTPSITSLPEYAGKGLNVVGGYVTVCSEPWGLATMFDAFANISQAPDASWICVPGRSTSVSVFQKRFTESLASSSIHMECNDLARSK